VRKSADRFIDLLYAVSKNLGQNPYLGRSRDDLRDGCRSSWLGSTWVITASRNPECASCHVLTAGAQSEIVQQCRCVDISRRDEPSECDGCFKPDRGSRWAVSSVKAGLQTAMYSAPPVPACCSEPIRLMGDHRLAGLTSSAPSRCSTRNRPASTTVNSSQPGVCPGSTQPPGLRMCATLSPLSRN